MSGAFSELYYRWLDGTPRPDSPLVRELSATYRGAWESGDLDERYHVIDFLRARRDLGGINLVIEGMQSDDARLAQHALHLVSTFIDEGHDPGPSADVALREVGVRFPEWAELSDEFLGDLRRLRASGG